MSYKPTKWENRVYDDKGNIIKDGTGLWAEYLNNMEDGILRANVFVDSKGNPDGIATLDENGIVNSSQLPANLKEMEVVHSLDEMEAVEPKFKGLRVMVIVDDRWKEFVYDGEQFIEVGSSEHLSITLDWDNIKDKPAEFKPEPHIHSEDDITDLDKYTKEEVDNKLSDKSAIGHSHTESDISDLDKYSTKEIDDKLEDKSDKTHTHSELHTHNNKNILDKIEDLGNHSKIDLDKIYTHTHRYDELLERPRIPDKLTDLTDNINIVSSDRKRKIHVSEVEPHDANEGDIWIRI